MVQTCPKRNEEYVDTVTSLRDIGRLIQEGHNAFDCENILKEKEPKEWTTEEKLIEDLRTFIRENSSEWI